MSNEPLSPQRLWARFRLMVIACLLGCPPRYGELRGRLRELAARRWMHPITGVPLKLGFSTIERWYYDARGADDPLEALMRKVRSDAGQPRILSREMIEKLVKQYQEHPGWTYELHHANLLALARKNPELGAVPSYPALQKFMRNAGLHKRPKRSHRHTEAAVKAEIRVETREVRSYEVRFAGELYHSDFHTPNIPLQLLTQNGTWVTPVLCGIVDDMSRLVCHAQWYLSEETAESYTHCMWQGFAKRGLCRNWMHDNGSAMKAGEVRNGLERLGIRVHDILAYSPEQNGKKESFWAKLESRLLPQLESVDPHHMTLDLLNEATFAWFEFEHNRERHSETGESPLDRFLGDRSVLRRSPTSEALRQMFTIEVGRRQRRSDGTTTIDGVRFEIPSAYRHLQNLTLRYARWDMSVAYLTDPREDRVLCALHPIDKRANADGRRRAIRSRTAGGRSVLPPGIAPHLLELIEELRATGLPTPYLRKE